ncbi:MAG: PKD domain-containing protein, partial [Anaerolineales bacterium]|nr:PKD domain-containing protein [Anaerolineales bacterium]
MLRSHRLLFPIFFLVLFGILILSGTWGATAAASLLAGGEVYAGFDYDQDRYNAPSEVSFSDTSSADDSIDSWYWDFGDGTTSKEQNPVHIFADADEYQVSLTVTA